MLKCLVCDGDMRPSGGVRLYHRECRKERNTLSREHRDHSRYRRYVVVPEMPRWMRDVGNPSAVLAARNFLAFWASRWLESPNDHPGP